MSRGALFLSLLAFAGSCAAAISSPPGVPSNLQVFADEEPAFALAGSGTMVYECRVDPTMPNRFAWSLVGPEVVLFDRDGKRVGRYARGPVFEVHGSLLPAQVMTFHDALKPTDAPWLLIAASRMGEGFFAGVTRVQQINTRSGAVPATPCDEARAGQQARIDFAADYYFYRRKTS